MNYSQAKEFLIKTFEDHHFQELLSQKLHHKKSISLEKCNNGSMISVSFPGYKAKQIGQRIIYDYRIDLHKNQRNTSLSHANIIIDIYNKIKAGGMSTEKLKQVIIKMSQTSELDIDEVIKFLPYTPTPPPPDLLKYVKQYHGQKHYNYFGNQNDLNLEELLLTMKWIVIQEDINYPIKEKFEGRRMCFSRYLEAIFILQNNNNHSLEELISRTLSHTKPQDWPEMDYSFKKLIS